MLNDVSAKYSALAEPNYVDIALAEDRVLLYNFAVVFYLPD